MTNYTKKTFYGTIIVFIFSLAAAFFAYLFRLLLAKNLSLTDFGLFFSFIAFANLLMVFRDIGLSQVSVYFFPRFIAKNKWGELKSLVSRILSIELITSVVIFGLLIVFSDSLARNYFHYADSKVILFFAIGFLVNSFELNFQIFFQAFQNQLLYASQNFLRNLLLLLGTIIAFFFFSGIYVPVVVYALTCLSILIFASFIFFKKIFPNFFRIESKQLDIKKILLFGFSGMFVLLGYLLINSTDTLILTYFRTLEDVGLYNSVIPIISLALYLPISIGIVLVPMTSSLCAKKELSTLKTAISLVTKFMFILMIPCAGILLLYPELALKLLFGSKFVTTATTSALAILGIGSIFYSIGHTNICFILGIKGPKKTIPVYASAVVANIILNIMLIHFFGILGAAIATAVTYFIIFILSSLVLHKIISFRANLIKYILTLLCGGIFISTIAYLKIKLILPVWIELLIVLCIATSVYLLLLFIFRITTMKELMGIKRQLFNV